MMPYIIGDIFAMILELVQAVIIILSLAILGLPAAMRSLGLPADTGVAAVIVGLGFYLLILAVVVYLFIVVWSYRFQDILQKT